MCTVDVTTSQTEWRVLGVVDFANPEGQSGSLEVDIFSGPKQTSTTTVFPNIPTYVGCYTDTIYKGSEQVDWVMDMEEKPSITQCVYYCITKLSTYAGIKVSATSSLLHVLQLLYAGKHIDLLFGQASMAGSAP